MKRISVQVPGNSYPVYIGENLFNELHRLVDKHALPKNIFFVIDSNVHKIHYKKIERIEKLIKDKSSKIIIEANENNKTLKTVSYIFSNLQQKGFGRDTLMIAIGGGIIGDIAGFAAATYMRGISYVQVPTTLLAAADSSVGGKTGVNFGKYKNQIGAFYQPSFVLIDPSFFKSLPFEELVCGFGEIVKYAYLTNSYFFNYVYRLSKKINSLTAKELIKLVSHSVNFKASVVTTDEKESGLRKILNLGHTFAHAIETAVNYKIKHGQAVVVGLACSFHLSYELELISKSQLDEFLKLLMNFKKYVSISSIDKSTTYKSMFTDKKNRDGKIRFVLLKAFGKILVDVEASKQHIFSAIEKGLQNFS
ncbi:3-dehydroquinate synthase [Melioribacteraceae bacterium 4301-Me]|uniref:3-dehydroquinate synthase n=1 Tax=Pyranulibacter aquaticus TaxID=3163344 RepID=UPI003597BDF0